MRDCPADFVLFQHKSKRRWLRSFHTTHPQNSALRSCCLARHPRQSHHHHIFVAHVGVVQRAHPVGRLPQCHSTITREHFDSPVVSTIPTHDFQWPAQSVATKRPLLQSELRLFIIVLLGSTLLARDLAASHKPGHSVATVITFSSETLTITAAVDPVTVPSTCTLLAQPWRDDGRHAPGCQLNKCSSFLQSFVPTQGCRRFRLA